MTFRFLALLLEYFCAAIRRGLEMEGKVVSTNGEKGCRVITDGVGGNAGSIRRDTTSTACCRFLDFSCPFNPTLDYSRTLILPRKASFA